MRKSTVIKGLAGRFRKKNPPPKKKKTKLSPELLCIIASLEPLTAATLLIMATASVYLNYMSFSDMLAAGMALWQAKTAAAVMSIAVGAGLMVFWAHVMGVVPIDQGSKKRRALYGATMLGCVLIFLISSWMNASALVGVRAQERYLAETLTAYQDVFDKVHRNALVVRQLVPFLEAEASRFAGMSRTERESGALTGSRSPGAVTATLDQVAGRLSSLMESINVSLKEADEDAKEARRHLKAMQDLLAGQGEFDKRLSAFADHAVALDALLASLSEQSVLPAIKHTAGALGSGLVMAAPSVQNGALAERQKSVMEGIGAAVHDIGGRLVTAASDIARQETAKVPAFKPLSRSDAVIHYARDFLPAWGAAISLDLMPLVIVLILTIVRMEPAPEPTSPALPRRQSAAEPVAPSEPEDFEKWLERRPGGLPGASGPKGDLS